MLSWGSSITTWPFFFVSAHKERMDYATHDGITVGSNTESAAELQTMLETPDVAVEAPAPAPVVEAVAQPAADETTERNADGTFKKRNRRDDPNVAVQSAIGKQREAERRAQAAEAELATLRAPKPAAAPVPSVAPDAEPNPDDAAKYPDGAFDRKFLKDQARWEARQEIQATQKASREQWERDRAAHEDNQRAQAFQTRLAKARANDSSFDTKLDLTMPMSAPMQAYVADSEIGPELLVYLTAHREDTQRLVTLHPIQVIREMAKLEAQLEAAASGPAPVAKVSHAKPPIQPVGSSPQLAEDDGSEDESVDKHIARENARERAARRR